MPSLLDFQDELPIALLDVLPNPVLVKNSDLTYVWANRAFEELFSVNRDELVGRLDKDIFPDRQASQCNGGDLRVLNTREMDEAYETVFTQDREARETVTRKSALVLADGTVLLVGVMHDITDVVRANQELERVGKLLNERAEALDRMAHTDSLTGCLNRRAFLDQADAKMKEDRSGILIADIDHFKAINDTYGHAAGDAALIHFVEIVNSSIRAEDSLARIGGEEFAILLPGASSVDLNEVGERIRKKVADSPVIHNGLEISMTVSIGGVLPTETDHLPLESMLQQADDCLYRAKSNGRDRLVLAA